MGDKVIPGVETPGRGGDFPGSAPSVWEGQVLTLVRYMGEQQVIRIIQQVESYFKLSYYVNFPLVMLSRVE